MQEDRAVRIARACTAYMWPLRASPAPPAGASIAQPASHRSGPLTEPRSREPVPNPANWPARPSAKNPFPAARADRAARLSPRGSRTGRRRRSTDQRTARDGNPSPARSIASSAALTSIAG
jgi:hypothetical protein